MHRRWPRRSTRPPRPPCTVQGYVDCGAVSRRTGPCETWDLPRASYRAIWEAMFLGRHRCGRPFEWPRSTNTPIGLGKGAESGGDLQGEGSTTLYRRKSRKRTNRLTGIRSSLRPKRRRVQGVARTRGSRESCAYTEIPGHCSESDRRRNLYVANGGHHVRSIDRAGSHRCPVVRTLGLGTQFASALAKDL